MGGVTPHGGFRFPLGPSKLKLMHTYIKPSYPYGHLRPVLKQALKLQGALSPPLLRAGGGVSFYLGLVPPPLPLKDLIIKGLKGCLEVPCAGRILRG